MPEIPENEQKLLEELGFKEDEKKPGDYKIEYTENNESVDAHVDYRKENGRRWARIAGKFVKSPDDIDILRKFKEEKDKLQSSGVGNSTSIAMNSPSTRDTSQSSNDDLEKKDSRIGGGLPPSIPHSTPISSPANKTYINAENMKLPQTFLDELVTAYEIEIAEIFGNAGDGKSTVVAKFALDAIAQGKKVLFVDTERGFTKRTREKLGNTYKYISNMKGLMDFCAQIPKDIDLLIIDSVGYPVLTEWAKLSMDDKGGALTKIIAIKDMIKDWAINNNKVAIVTNQPDSDFGKDRNYVNRPFGDKGQFVIKEVFKIERVESSPVRTKSVLKVFRSRYDARGVKVADIEITNDGVKIT